MTRNLTVRESEEWAEIVITYLEANGYPFDRNSKSLPVYLADCLTDLTGSSATVYSDTLTDIIAKLASHYSGLSLDRNNCDFTDALGILNHALLTAGSGGEGGDGGGDEPTPLGVIDLENGVYSWGATTKTRADLFDSASTWNFSSGNLTANGYEGEAFAALLNEALTALQAGCVMVMDRTIGGGGVVSLEFYSAPGFETDGIYSCGEAAATISDGNGGGSASAPSSAGRAKTSFLITDTVQKVSDQGGTVATCDPAIAWTTPPNLAAISVGAGCILHSIKFYSVSPIFN